MASVPVSAAVFDGFLGSLADQVAEGGDVAAGALVQVFSLFFFFRPRTASRTESSPGSSPDVGAAFV